MEEAGVGAVGVEEALLLLPADPLAILLVLSCHPLQLRGGTATLCEEVAAGVGHGGLGGAHHGGAAVHGGAGDVSDAPLPEVTLEVRCPGVKGEAELDEGEVGAGGPGLAQLLAGHLVGDRLAQDQVVHVGDAEARLLEQLTAVGGGARSGLGQWRQDGWWDVRDLMHWSSIRTWNMDNSLAWS